MFRWGLVLRQRRRSSSPALPGCFCRLGFSMIVRGEPGFKPVCSCLMVSVPASGLSEVLCVSFSNIADVDPGRAVGGRDVAEPAFRAAGHPARRGFGRECHASSIPADLTSIGLAVPLGAPEGHGQNGRPTDHCGSHRLQFRAAPALWHLCQKGTLSSIAISLPTVV